VFHIDFIISIMSKRLVNGRAYVHSQCEAKFQFVQRRESVTVCNLLGRSAMLRNLHTADEWESEWE
jgi:hypothetical protein